MGVANEVFAKADCIIPRDYDTREHSHLVLCLYVKSEEFEKTDKAQTGRLRISCIMDKIDRALYERCADIKILASDLIITSRDSQGYFCRL